MAHVPLPGSEPPPLPEPRGLQKPPADFVVRLSVLLKRSAAARERLAEAAKGLERALPRDRKYLTRESMAELTAVAPDALERIRAFAREFHLRMDEQSGLAARGHVILTGSVADVERAFHVRLLLHRAHEQTGLWHEGPVSVPADLHDVIEAVIGLHSEPMDAHAAPARRGAKPPAGVDPRDVATAYDFPCGDAGGECIAIILLGGGFDTADLAPYFSGLGLPIPQIDVVQVNGQTNNPAPAASIAAMLAGTPPDPQTLWTIEASLDVELIGTLANAAHIVVYFAPNTSQGKLEAFDRAMSDPFGVSVISCSFGSYEASLTTAYLQQLDDRFAMAALQGITVCVSSGDRGDGAEGGRVPRVRFPASSPNVLACGGTHALLKGGALVESVWDEMFFGQHFSSGGGVSGFFPLPSWQQSADVPGATGGATGRGVPDVAAKADMLTGYPIRVRGFVFNMGGTSAAAPLWASLAARINRSLGVRIGHMNALLYAKPSALRDITNGSSGVHFSARQDWDACTGLGSPRGEALIRVL